MYHHELYHHYEEFLKQVNTEDDLIDVAFKSNLSYTNILEHNTPEQGLEYLKCIEREFPEISYDDLREYVDVNDRWGGTTTSVFTTNKNKILGCSPSSLRYVHHALLILEDFKTSGCRQMVEVGCGYGGLFLAINAFQDKFGISVDQYNMVDLPDVCNLVNKYLKMNKDHIRVPYRIFESTQFGADVPTHSPRDLYFISNYCFSEVGEDIRQEYIDALFPKVAHGFMVFQTCFGMHLSSLDGVIHMPILKSEEERPQTGPEYAPNYFVYF